VLEAKLAEGRAKLLQHRAGRVRRAWTIKYYWVWNALMNTACSKVFAATGDERTVSWRSQTCVFCCSGLPMARFFSYLEKKYRPAPRLFRRLRVFNTGAGALAGDYG